MILNNRFDKSLVHTNDLDALIHYINYNRINSTDSIKNLYKRYDNITLYRGMNVSDDEYKDISDTLSISGDMLSWSTRLENANRYRTIEMDKMIKYPPIFGPTESKPWLINRHAIIIKYVGSIDGIDTHDYNIDYRWGDTYEVITKGTYKISIIAHGQIW